MEKARLQNEAKKLREDMARIDGKLANENFVKKAPAAVVDAERAKRAEAEKVLTELQNTYRGLFHEEV